MTETLVVLDFETTGLNPEDGDRITEVGAVRIQRGQITDRYESLVNCGARVSRFITQYTGITQRMVDTAPPVDAVMRELLGFIDSSHVVAHNASFDQRFFESECDHTGLRGNADLFICSMRLAKRLYPEISTHRLQHLAVELGIPYSSPAHRAAADASVTAKLVIRICNDLKARHRRLSLDAALLREITRMRIADAMTILATMSPTEAA
jgi:DNA polymerase III subunit epsilon